MEFLTLVPSSPVFSTDAYRSRRRRRLIHHPARVYACKLPSGPDEDTQPTSSVRRPLAPPLPPLLEDLVPIPNTNLQTPKNRYNVISRNPLASHLWLSSKLSPPPPPDEKDDIFHSPSPALSPKLTPTLTPDPTPPPETDFRQKGKIFVGNLPLWMKKNEIAEYFRQLGPVKSVVLIKGHHDPRRNVGYCFVVYGGPTAEESAEKAVEFDGVEFHGRVLTVRLDDGRRLKTRSNERERWVAGDDRTEHRSKWHEEREVACRKFRRVLDTHPDNWQAVVSAFDKITKPTRREFGLMINFYSRRGDKHHARATFESMRARGIEPNSYVYTNLIHAYRVARDMRGALSCVEEMKEENIEMTVVTYSILNAIFSSPLTAWAHQNIEHICLHKDLDTDNILLFAVSLGGILLFFWARCKSAELIFPIYAL